MRILFLTCLALIAFAANSLLNRAAFVEAEMGPAAFTAIRIVSGAVMLGVLISLRGNRRALIGAGSWVSAGALLLYAVAFSFAYLTLDAGLGALILFGGVQITMFGGTLLGGGRPSLWRWIGSALGLAGLAVMFLPGSSAPDPLGVVLMLAAAFGWGIYSLRGQKVGDPLIVTAGNFLRAVPVALLIWLGFGADAGISVSGGMLAIASGAFASGCGYAIWYSVLPRLDTTLAAIAQLSVPLIAMGGGMVFLGETLTVTFFVASALILGGILLAVFGPERQS